MPITKSAAKALKQSHKRHAQNLKTKKNVKEAIKGATDEKSLSKAQSVIDRAAKTNYIHKNKAARLKSRLAKKISKKK